MKDKYPIHIGLTSLHGLSDLEGAFARVLVEVVLVLHAPLAAHEFHEDRPTHTVNFAE